MKSNILKITPLASLFFLMACGSSNVENRSMKTVLRPATDAPAVFEAPAGTTMRNNGCLSPLTDPRNGTRIIMRTSFGEEGMGDYVVPDGTYGVKNGELLRVNCTTGEVVGIVKR